MTSCRHGRTLKEGKTTGYIGFDPLRFVAYCHLVQIMTMVQFQRAGHKRSPCGRCNRNGGDPSGKSAERNLLSEEVLRHNEACVKKQLEKFLDFSSSTQVPKWLTTTIVQGLQFLDFIRDVGKHISLAT